MAERICLACGVSLEGDRTSRKYCGKRECQRVRSKHKVERAGQARLCRECNGSLAGTPGAQKTCDACKAKRASAPKRKRRPAAVVAAARERPPSPPARGARAGWTSSFGGPALGVEMRRRQADLMAEARERLRGVAVGGER